MKGKLLKKITISALFLCVFLLTQNLGIQAKTCACPTQITASAMEIPVKNKSNDFLKEIAKPYLGVYECKRLYYGSENKKDIFEYLRVELKSKGELLVTYKLKDGENGKVPLSYEYDFQEKQLRVTGQWLLLRIDKKFPLKNGEINVVMNLFGKLVNVTFSKA